MIFENRVRVENHFPVEIFEIFHFQKHPPNILKTLQKKNFKNLDFSLIENPDYHRIVVHLIGFWMVSVVGVELLNHHNGGRLGAVIGSKAFNRKRNS